MSSQAHAPAASRRGPGRAGDWIVSRTSQLRHWLDWSGQAIGALVYPWECLVCGAGAESSPFCPNCRPVLLACAGPACLRCAMPLGPWSSANDGCFECRGRSLGFHRAVALGSYEGPVRELCLKLKHEPNAWLAPWLADVLVEAHPGLRNEPKDAWVVPVPLHWRRHWSRGYNQADALARGLADRLSFRVRQPLRRVVATPPLALLGRTERSRLMRGAFRTQHHKGLEGRTVLLVDDILTSGATSGAAARALRRAGAARVVVVVVARAQGKP